LGSKFLRKGTLEPDRLTIHSPDTKKYFIRQCPIWLSTYTTTIPPVFISKLRKCQTFWKFQNLYLSYVSVPAVQCLMTFILATENWVNNTISLYFLRIRLRTIRVIPGICKKVLTKTHYF
jgi:hypothetical protein